MNLAAKLRPIPATARITDPNHHVWCGSPVQADNGEWHLFASHWPRTAGFEGWVTHSRIGRYVSESLFGPWRYAGVVLSPHDGDDWDAHVTHNPMAVRWQGGVALFYMGTRGSTGPDGPTFTPQDAVWWDFRNHQRIGVAVAPAPDQPFVRLPQPVIDIAPGWRARMTSNPTVAVQPDGTLRMVFKAVADGKGHFGGEVVHGVAESASPTGPWTVMPEPTLRIPGVQFPAEDPCIWHQDHCWWMVAKDFHGHFTGAGTSLALFMSADGRTWTPAPQPLVSTLSLTWADGSTMSVERLERPAVVCVHGKPVALAVAVKHHDDTVLVQIPLAD